MPYDVLYNVTHCIIKDTLMSAKHLTHSILKGVFEGLLYLRSKSIHILSGLDLSSCFIFTFFCTILYKIYSKTLILKVTS